MTRMEMTLTRRALLSTDVPSYTVCVRACIAMCGWCRYVPHGAVLSHHVASGWAARANPGDAPSSTRSDALVYHRASYCWERCRCEPRRLSLLAPLASLTGGNISSPLQQPVSLLTSLLHTHAQLACTHQVRVHSSCQPTHSPYLWSCTYPMDATLFPSFRYVSALLLHCNTIQPACTYIHIYIPSYLQVKTPSESA